MESTTVVHEVSASLPVPRSQRERARLTDVLTARLRLAAPGSGERRRLVDELILVHTTMARSMAARYRNRGIDLDDLEQVAVLGLIKAAQRFDPAAGHDFMAYATPTIRGELRKHFRDSGWMIRPPRRIQELQARIFDARGTLENRLGRSPRSSEVAAHLDVDVCDVEEALAADGCFTPRSLDAPVGDGTSAVGDMLGEDDCAFGSAEARVALRTVVHRLSDRDRSIVYLRFFQDSTPQEIADLVGLTQAQVSRTLTRILGDLRVGFDESGTAA